MQPANTHTYTCLQLQSITKTILCHKNSNYLPPKIARIVLVYLHAVYLPLSVKKRGSFVLDSLVYEESLIQTMRGSLSSNTKFHIYVDVVTEHFYFMIVGIKVSI